MTLRKDKNAILKSFTSEIQCKKHFQKENKFSIWWGLMGKRLAVIEKRQDWITKAVEEVAVMFNNSI